MREAISHYSAKITLKSAKNVVFSIFCKPIRGTVAPPASWLRYSLCLVVLSKLRLLKILKLVNYKTSEDYFVFYSFICIRNCYSQTSKPDYSSKLLFTDLKATWPPDLKASGGWEGRPQTPVCDTFELHQLTQHVSQVGHCTF